MHICRSVETTMQTTMQTLLPGRGAAQGGGGSNGPLVKRQRTMDMADALLTTDEQLVRPPSFRAQKSGVSPFRALRV